MNIDELWATQEVVTILILQNFWLSTVSNVTVMAPLSAYLVSEPLGLTLGSQCTLETVKIYLLLKNFYFVQNS